MLENMYRCELKPRLGIPGQARNAKSGFELTISYFQAFPGNAKNNVGSAGSTLFFACPGNAATKLQKKVSEWGPEKSSGICRPGWGLQAKLWPRPDFQVWPKTSKVVRNGFRIDGSA